MDASGRLYSCERDERRVSRLEKDGSVTVIASSWQGKMLNSPNDVVVRRESHVYFSDPRWTLYVADSQERKIYAYDLDVEGNASHEWVFIAGIEGTPDGLRVAKNGNLYNPPIVHVGRWHARAHPDHATDHRGGAQSENPERSRTKSRPGPQGAPNRPQVGNRLATCPTQAGGSGERPRRLTSSFIGRENSGRARGARTSAGTTHNRVNAVRLSPGMDARKTMRGLVG